MRPAKFFNCPLCKAKNAVYQSASREETRPGNDQGGSGTQAALGNYSVSWVGGKFDYSHAQRCPYLRKVIHKEELLAFYLEQCEITHSDFATFTDYKKMFKEIGVTIKVDNEPVKLLGGSEQWKVRMYLAYKKKRIKTVPKAEGYNPDHAFDNLRHKLLCGEIIDVAGVSWQVIPNGKGMPELKRLEK